MSLWNIETRKQVGILNNSPRKSFQGLYATWTEEIQWLLAEILSNTLNMSAGDTVSFFYQQSLQIRKATVRNVKVWPHMKNWSVIFWNRPVKYIHLQNYISNWFLFCPAQLSQCMWKYLIAKRAPSTYNCRIWNSIEITESAFHHYANLPLVRRTYSFALSCCLQNRWFKTWDCNKMNLPGLFHMIRINFFSVKYTT